MAAQAESTRLLHRREVMVRLLHRRGQGLFSCTAGASVTDFDMIGAALSELLNALSGAMALAFQGAVADVTNPADVVVIALEAMGADGEDVHVLATVCWRLKIWAEHVFRVVDEHIASLAVGSGADSDIDSHDSALSPLTEGSG